MVAVKDTVDQVAGLEKYEHGFVTEIEQEFAPKGLNRDTVAFISAKKEEPEWMLAWRLEAFDRWSAMESPDWARVSFPPIDYQDATYYAALMVKATTTPTIVGTLLHHANVSGNLASLGYSVLAQTSGSALTTTAPATIATPASTAAVPLVIAS